MAKIEAIEYQIQEDCKEFNLKEIKEFLKALYSDERITKRIDDSFISLSVKFKEPLDLFVIRQSDIDAAKIERENRGNQNA